MGPHGMIRRGRAGQHRGRDVSELHPISDICKDPARRDTRRADVVFVHGLMGDPFGTWRCGDTDETSWPHWVAKEFPDVGVWSLGYPAPLSRWPTKVRLLLGLFVQMRASTIAKGHAMRLQRRAVNVLDRLAQKGIGQRPLVFVCHSLGGLLVKQVLRAADMSREPGKEAIAESISDILFLATPHHGADLAVLAKHLENLLQTSVIVDDLIAHGVHLEELAEDYKTYAGRYGFETHTYFEDIGIRGSEVLVVNSTSANPGIGRRPVGLDRDHGSICKPEKRDDPVCDRLREILAAIPGSAPAPRRVEGSIEQPVPHTTPAATPSAPPVQVHVHIPQSVSTQPPAIPCILPDAASRFFGRKDALEMLVQRLETQRSTVVAGAAGLGKTALAAEALRRVLGDRPSARLPETPFPDGIVNVDLYSEKDQPRMCWKRIADAVRGVGFLQDQPEEVRAREACRGRRLLLIVEGGEEADGGSRPEGGQRPSRRSLLEPLAWEGAVLWLTRPTPYSPRPDIALNEPLGEQEASDLLTHLTQDAPMRLSDADRQALLQSMDGHPLALTWAGGLLQQGGLRPAELVADFRQQPARNLHDPEDARHTLHWLFQRSVRLLDADARETLAAAGLLAHAPFLAEAVCAATGLDADRQRQVLRQCAQSRLLMPVDDAELPDHWRFGHALGYQFARVLGDEGDPAPREAMLERLMVWADVRLQAELAANAPARALVHVEVLLQAAQPPQGWRPLASNLLYDYENRLEALGRLGDRLAAMGLVERWWQRLPEDLRREAEWQREASAIDEKLGNALLVRGDLAGAQRRYEAGLRIREGLATRDPKNAGWQRDLSVSESRLGDVLKALGDLAGAQRRYEASLRIREALALREPENAGWQRDVSVSESRLGNILQARGDLVGAQRRYEAALRIIKTLAARDPENAATQRDLSVSENKLANVLHAQGDLTGAQRRYEAGLQIIKTLAARDQENAVWQHDLSVSENRLGDMLHAQGDLAGARRRYEASLLIVEALAMRDRENAGWQRELSVGENKLGDVLQAQGDLAGAQRRYEAGLRIRAALALRDSENAGWQRDLSVSEHKLGDVLQAQGDLAGAQRHYEADLRISETLAVRDPENADWQHDLMLSRVKLGGLCRAQKDVPGARAHWVEARRILQFLLERWPEHPQFQRDVAGIEQAIASLDD